MTTINYWGPAYPDLHNKDLEYAGQTETGFIRVVNPDTGRFIRLNPDYCVETGDES